MLTVVLADAKDIPPRNWDRRKDFDSFDLVGRAKENSIDVTSLLFEALDQFEHAPGDAVRREIEDSGSLLVQHADALALVFPKGNQFHGVLLSCEPYADASRFRFDLAHQRSNLLHHP